MAEEERELTWYCNAYPDRVDELELESVKGVALLHGDCTELVPTGELGPPNDGGDAELAAKFKADGIVGIYRRDGVGPMRF